MCLVNLVFVLGFPLTMAFADPWDLIQGIPLITSLFLVLPLLATPMAVIHPVLTGLSWSGGQLGLTSRLFLTLLAFAGVAFITVLVYWNLLGFHY